MEWKVIDSFESISPDVIGALKAAQRILWEYDRVIEVATKVWKIDNEFTDRMKEIKMSYRDELKMLSNILIKNREGSLPF